MSLRFNKQTRRPGRDREPTHQTSRRTDAAAAITNQQLGSQASSNNQPNSNRRRARSNSLPFRVVWGTPRSCSSQVIKKAICALLPNTTWQSVQVKSSQRQRGSRWIWWHTIIAPEGVMATIDQVWHTLEAKTCWSLRSSLANNSSNPRHLHSASGQPVEAEVGVSTDDPPPHQLEQRVPPSSRESFPCTEPASCPTSTGGAEAITLPVPLSQSWKN